MAKHLTKQMTKHMTEEMTNRMTDSTMSRSLHDLVHTGLCMDMHRSTLVYISIYIYICISIYIYTYVYTHTYKYEPSSESLALGATACTRLAAPYKIRAWLGRSIGRLRGNLVASWGELWPIWGQREVNLGQLGPNLGPTGTTWPNLEAKFCRIRKSFWMVGGVRGTRK